MLFLILLTVAVKANLVVLDGPLTGSYDCVSAGWPLSSPIFNRTITLAQPIDACKAIATVDDIVVITGNGGCFPIIKVRNAVAAGAKGVLMFGFSDGFGSLETLNTYDRGSDIQIFVGELPKHFGTSFVNSLTNATINLSFDVNSRAAVDSSPYWIFYAVIQILVNTLLILICIHRMVAYGWTRHFTIGTLAYIISFIGCVFRIVQAIDPTGYARVFNFTERTVLAAIPLTTTVCVAVAIGFYWLDVFDENKLSTRITILRRYKVHCTIVLIVIIALSLSATVLQSLLIDSLVNLLAAALYGIVTIVILIFFIYCCHFIRVYLKQFPKGQVGRVIRKLLYLGIGQCCCLIVYGLIVILLTSPISNSPILGVVTQSALYYVSTILAAIQIAMFANPADGYIFCIEAKVTDVDTVTFSRGIEL